MVNIVAGVALLSFLELRERHRLEAWPFQPALYVPGYLSTRDAPLRWRFSPTGGRNRLGLRNREIQDKRFGVRRILFLGDSPFWSGETSSGELYTAVLEKRFNSHSGERKFPVEIINAGIPGYTTYQELEFLKIYGLDMKPDVVVLGFVFNDLFYKYLHRPSKKNLLNIDPATYRYRFDPDGLLGAFFGWSYFAHTIAYRGQHFWKSRMHHPIFPFEERIDFYLAWKSYGWTQVGRLIGEMKALLAERHIPLQLVVFPVSDQVNDQTENATNHTFSISKKRIRENCEQPGIPMLDLTDAIYRNGGTAVFKDYLHLNGKGNDIVADEIYKHLRVDWPLP